MSLEKRDAELNFVSEQRSYIYISWLHNQILRVSFINAVLTGAGPDVTGNDAPYHRVRLKTLLGAFVAEEYASPGAGVLAWLRGAAIAIYVLRKPLVF